MICRKCGHQWMNPPGPLPRDWWKSIDCPNCSSPIFKDGKYIEEVAKQ